jgi:hypothetical protein
VVIAAGIIILVPFPGALFNSTLEANYVRITGRVRRARRRARDLAARLVGPLRGRLGLDSVPLTVDERTTPGSDVEPAPDQRSGAERHTLWQTPLGVGLFVGLTALLAGFLDPAFGLNAASMVTFIGMLLGLVIVLAAFDLPLVVLYRRRAISFTFHALPGTALVAIACVLISRLTNFQPGYLYGLIIAMVAAQKLEKPAKGRLMAIGTLSTILVAVIAWFALGFVSPLAAAAPDPSPVLIIAQTVLSMVVAAGVELAAFGMLPMSFLAGESVRKWSRPAWLGLIGFGWIAFLIVILNPQNGYLSDSTRTPLFTIVALLVVFSVGSFLFWNYFRRNPTVAGGTGI